MTIDVSIENCWSCHYSRRRFQRTSLTSRDSYFDFSSCVTLDRVNTECDKHDRSWILVIFTCRTKNRGWWRGESLPSWFEAEDNRVVKKIDSSLEAKNLVLSGWLIRLLSLSIDKLCLCFHVRDLRHSLRTVGSIRSILPSWFPIQPRTALSFVRGWTLCVFSGQWAFWCAMLVSLPTMLRSKVKIHTALIQCISEGAPSNGLCWFVIFCWIFQPVISVWLLDASIWNDL